MSCEDKSKNIYNEISNYTTNFALNKFLFQFNEHGDCLRDSFTEMCIVQVSVIKA